MTEVWSRLEKLRREGPRTDAYAFEQPFAAPDGTGGLVAGDLGLCRTGRRSRVSVWDAIEWQG